MRPIHRGRSHGLVGRDRARSAWPGTRGRRGHDAGWRRPLLRTASTAFSSISGTCLYAAAWKTTAGRARRTPRARAPRPSRLASTETTRPKCRSNSSSRRISKRLFSALSNSTSCFGPTRAIWRQSSAADRAARAGDQHHLAAQVGAPPRPPPPGPARGREHPPRAPRAPGAVRSTPPDSSSNTVGSVRTGMLRARHAVTTFWRRTPGAEGWR